MTTTSTAAAAAAAITTFLRAMQPSVSDSRFNDACINSLLSNTTNLLDVVFVNQYGTKIAPNDINPSVYSSIWGINYNSCDQYCGWSTVHLPFSYSGFSSAMTNYLLPWLALTAQLPYETGSTRDNILALVIALGSPVLIAYSLSITVMNVYTLKRHFKRLRDMDNLSHTYPTHLQTINEVLQTAQHVPLRANQQHGWLSSLLLLEANDPWWSRVQEYLSDHVRDFTPSALAQLGAAILAWILTTLAALWTSLGDPNTALQNASGSVWLWLVPVVVGYIKVGVPNSSTVAAKAFKIDRARKAGSEGAVQATSPMIAITHADSHLSGDKGKARVTELSLAPSSRNGNAGPSRSTSQSSVSMHGRPELRQERESYEMTPAYTAPDVPPTVARHADAAIDKIAVSAGPRASGVLDGTGTQRGILTSGNCFTASGSVSHHIHKALSRPVLGDADIPGAAYTYARSLQFPFFTELLISALQHSMDRDPERTASEANSGDMDAIAAQCGPDWRPDMKINPFPSWSQISIDSRNIMVVASVVALTVQWGTLMASFELAYKTPVEGLGCRSGSYLIYGTVSTVAWAVLVLSQFCSNEAMRRRQEKAWGSAGSDPRPQALHAPGRTAKATQQQPAEATPIAPQAVVDPADDLRRRSTAEREANAPPAARPTFLERFAVALRVFGKSLCFLNTIWLIGTSLCEIIGVFDQCWCAANRPSVPADRAFVVLFQPASALASSAVDPWWGGFAMSLFFVLSTGAIFWMGSSRSLTS